MSGTGLEYKSNKSQRKSSFWDSKLYNRRNFWRTFGSRKYKDGDLEKLPVCRIPLNQRAEPCVSLTWRSAVSKRAGTSFFQFQIFAIVFLCSPALFNHSGEISCASINRAHLLQGRWVTKSSNVIEWNWFNVAWAERRAFSSAWIELRAFKKSWAPPPGRKPLYPTPRA